MIRFLDYRLPISIYDHVSIDIFLLVNVSFTNTGFCFVVFNVFNVFNVVYNGG